MQWKQKILNAKQLYDTNHNYHPIFTPQDLSLAQLWSTSPISEFSPHPNLLFKNNDISQGPIDIYLILDSIYFTKGIENDDLPLTYFSFLSLQKQYNDLILGIDRITHLKQFLHEWYNYIPPFLVPLILRRLNAA